MSQMLDPTFYRSPGEAMAAPPEQLAYVAAHDPASARHGQVVGWSELPTAGNELHHFGWNACSSCLCPNAPHPHVERRYLVVPGLRSEIEVLASDLQVGGRPGGRVPHDQHRLEDLHAGLALGAGVDRVRSGTDDEPRRVP